MDVSMLEYELK